MYYQSENALEKKKIKVRMLYKPEHNHVESTKHQFMPKLNSFKIYWTDNGGFGSKSVSMEHIVT